MSWLLRAESVKGGVLVYWNCSTVGLRDVVSDEVCWRAHAEASAAHQVVYGQLSKGENGRQCRHVGFVVHSDSSLVGLGNMKINCVRELSMQPSMASGIGPWPEHQCILHGTAPFARGA